MGHASVHGPDYSFTAMEWEAQNNTSLEEDMLEYHIVVFSSSVITPEPLYSCIGQCLE